MPAESLLTFSRDGIYCPQADVYIDPWKPVDKAIITHAHADHSRWGMKHYLAHHDSIPVMRHRLGEDISVEGKAYGESFTINGVKFSLHPAGHIIGSAQIRVEYKGEVWVASGDYKLEDDGSCAPFEAVKCDSFITESTFGLPVYKWKPQAEIMAAINQWWAECKAEGKTAVVFSYALGKAQRIIDNLDQSIGPILTHGAVENTNRVLREAGISVAPTTLITRDTNIKDYKGAIVIAPPSAGGSPWMKRLAPYSTAIASGWATLRGARRRRNTDKGFVLSDHADWEGLNSAISAIGCERVYVTHGYTGIFSQWLREKGYDARAVETEYEGEEEADPSTALGDLPAASEIENTSGVSTEHTSTKFNDMNVASDASTEGTSVDSNTKRPSTALRVLPVASDAERSRSARGGSVKTEPES